MKHNLGGRHWGALVGVVVATLALTACGSSSGGGTSPGSSAGSGSRSSSAPTSCGSGSLKAEGSTAQQNAMSQWIKDYQSKCSGTTVTYNGTGSGAGIKQFNGNQVDFAGSDSALNSAKGETAAAAKRCGSPALNLPMVTGPIAVAFKVKGIDDGGLTFTPDVLAKVMLGKITKWNDPEIAKANSGVSLPDENITVFFRGDPSGTTENFEKYLKASAPSMFTADTGKDWAGKVGQGKNKSQGVQQALSSTEGSISYIEWSFAVNGGLSTAKIDNGGGAVALDADTAAAAVAAAKIAGTGKDLSLKLDYATKAQGAYPIILVTYEIVCSKYASADTAKLVKAFLTYTAGAGQSGLKDLGYAPLPDEIKTKLTASIQSVS